MSFLEPGSGEDFRSSWEPHYTVALKTLAKIGNPFGDFPFLNIEDL